MAYSAYVPWHSGDILLSLTQREPAVLLSLWSVGGSVCIFYGAGVLYQQIAAKGM